MNDPTQQESSDAPAADAPIDGVDPVEDFWSATALTPWNVATFWERVARSAPPPPPLHPLASAAAGEDLPVVDDRFQRRLASRRSGRDFAPSALSRVEVARVLAAAGVDADGRRVVPRAGDFDSIHLYLLARRVAGCDPGSTWRYDHDRHRLVRVGDASPDVAATMCSLGDDDPAAIVVFIIEPSRTIARYGAHGERFGLQEVGHAMQNVLLRMHHDNLTGFPMGGLVDALVLDALGLTGTAVRVGGGVTVGHPRRPSPRRRKRTWHQIR